MASSQTYYPWYSNHPSTAFRPVPPVPGEVQPDTMARCMARLNERVEDNIWFDPVTLPVDVDASSTTTSQAGGSATGSGAPATGQGSRRSKRSSKFGSRNSSDREGNGGPEQPQQEGGGAPAVPPLPLLEMQAVPHDRTRPSLPEFGPDYRPVRELVVGLAHTARPPGEHLGKASRKLDAAASRRDRFGNFHRQVLSARSPRSRACHTHSTKVKIVQPQQRKRPARQDCGACSAQQWLGTHFCVLLLYIFFDMQVSTYKKWAALRLRDGGYHQTGVHIDGPFKDQTEKDAEEYREGKKKWLGGPFIVVPATAAAAHRAWKQKCDIGSPGKWQGGPDTMLGRPEEKHKWVSDYRWDPTVDFPISKK